MTTADALSILCDALEHTLPQFENNLAHAIDKTLGPSDVLAVRSIRNQESDPLHWRWMQGDGFRPWGARHENNPIYLQAVELDPPVIGDGSCRYQFHNYVVSQWPQGLLAFSAALKRQSESLFSRLKGGFVSSAPWPLRTSDDMPIVARCLNIDLNDVCTRQLLLHVGIPMYIIHL